MGSLLETGKIDRTCQGRPDRRSGTRHVIKSVTPRRLPIHPVAAVSRLAN
ncbi:hypothetical protein MMMB2_2422 [Mycobacterium marinum MB2]|nr:hypothetical protein MMSP_4392 [Mycobacterium sp. 012931]EPQ77760.1 hypothetical protein MMMB2_2422 [Mycobacterium marinum MB2]